MTVGTAPMYGPNTGTMFVAFNLNSRKNKNGEFYVNPIKQKWFNDLNFRTAVDYVIDRNAMVNNVANGVAQPLFTSESLSSIFLNEKIASGHERNLEYAKELLAKSGFYWDKNGYLIDKNDPDELMAAMEKLLSGGKALVQNLKKDHMNLLAKYSWDSVADRIIDVLEKQGFALEKDAFK